jgi:cell fate regulator YaaT (PSP1 superfamily)
MRNQQHDVEQKICYGIIHPMQSNIIGVRFTKIGKIYHFDSGPVEDLKIGDHVIVETSRGKHLGEVMQVLDSPSEKPDRGWKPVNRRATPRDLLLQKTWQARQTEAMIECRAKAAEMKLEGVKIVAAEYNYDGSRLTYMYSTESEEKVNLKKLKQAMNRKYREPQIEMRQIGPRDVAKIIGGMGACGLETRCCSKFLTDFSPISIKMAKAQGISLTPSEITGMCGRLRCCLIYEYEQYAAARKEMPKRKKQVVTPLGRGKVVDVSPLTGMVTVQIEDDSRQSYQTFHKDELEPWDELEALRRKAESPCDKHEGGQCDCQTEPDSQGEKSATKKPKGKNR